MDKLPGHLARHAELFARCAEIIHCDSQSKDGTPAFVAKTLNFPTLKQVDHPPGLYQSWNHALQQCTQTFIYISTVGDDIDADGLERLLALAVETDADIVMSPPRFIDEAGRLQSELRWPINNLILNHGIKKAGVVPSRLVYAEAVFHAPDGIMGSAASCLYRTSFLKPRPFPLGFHGACDSAWALRHVPEAHCAIIPDPLSTFLLHPKSYESHGMVNAQIAVLIRDFLRRELHQLRKNPIHISQQSAGLPAPLLQQLRDFNLIALLRARQEKNLITLRKKMRGLWILNPRVWTVRRHRDYYRSLAAKYAARARNELTSSLERTSAT